MQQWQGSSRLMCSLFLEIKPTNTPTSNLLLYIIAKLWPQLQFAQTWNMCNSS